MNKKNPFNPVSYKNRFNTEKYDRINLMIPKGEKDHLKSHAESHGESLNEFIKRAISEQICRDTEE